MRANAGGSLMHSLWDGVAGWSPHRIVSRLFIREAGLRGVPEDVAVVREIALALRDRDGMDPFVKGAAGSSGQAGVSASCPADLVVRRGLDCGISREIVREQSCPSDLLEAGRAAFDEARRRGSKGALAPLPLFVQDARTAARSRAGSSVRDSVTQWLQSKEAEDWCRDRKALSPERPISFLSRHGVLVPMGLH